MDGPTRRCARCDERKTVRGIWYLVALGGASEPTFLCESCYQVQWGPARGEAAALADGPTMPGAVEAELPFGGDAPDLR